MDLLFLHHPVQWWMGLGTSDQLALIAVTVGFLMVLVATWMGLRRWWRGWTQNQNDDE
jgi:hypothetical protein